MMRKSIIALAVSLGTVTATHAAERDHKAEQLARFTCEIKVSAIAYIIGAGTLAGFRSYSTFEDGGLHGKASEGVQVSYYVNGTHGEVAIYRDAAAGYAPNVIGLLDMETGMVFEVDGPIRIGTCRYLPTFNFETAGFQKAQRQALDLADKQARERQSEEADERERAREAARRRQPQP